MSLCMIYQIPIESLEPSCLDIGDVSSNKSNSVAMFIGFNEGTIIKYELRPLADDSSSSNDLYFYVRETYTLDLLKELRKRSYHITSNQRSKSLSSMNDNGNDDISIRKELKAVPLTMKCINSVDSFSFLMILTSSGIVITDEVGTFLSLL
jgi:uncharacterized protein YukJ